MSTMTFKKLCEKLLQVILLLVGLFFLQVIILNALPLILPVDNFNVYLIIISNSHWIGNLIFGLVILWLTRRMGLIAIPIGILSVVLPTYGPIFYILTTLQNRSTDD